jgi:GT2 family glycosyltransferase
MSGSEGAVLASPFPPTLVLAPTSRAPTRLPEATVAAVLSAPLPAALPRPVGWAGSGEGKTVSIAVVTFNNLVLTNTEYPSYEVIVVDNGSTDGTRAYLDELARRHRHVRVHFNEGNRGFAPANNQALAAARGEVLVLLNNDTIVPRGWLGRLVAHLEEPAIGAVGPVTNRIGNEAQIDAPYRTYGELLAFAGDYVARHAGERFDIRMLAMYCLAMRREVYQQIGPIDERYELGMLEDDDYAVRLHAAGYRVVCAEDVFVHHFGQASFGNLIPSGEFGRLLEANRRRFREKWGVAWEPYRRRRSREHEELIGRVRGVVARATPAGATVAVVSRGDDELVELDGRRGWHFPQNADGVYAGHHPADSAAAIASLEALRARGADYLLFPRTAYWWLDYYTAFKQHLDRSYPVVSHGEDDAVVFALRDRADQARGP